MSDLAPIMPVLTAIKVVTSFGCALAAFMLSYSFQKTVASVSPLPSLGASPDPSLCGWKSLGAAGGGFIAALLDFQAFMSVLGLPAVPSRTTALCAVLLFVACFVSGMVGFIVCLKIKQPWQVAIFGGGAAFTGALLTLPDVLRGFNVL